jgi:hypothetical protein
LYATALLPLMLSSSSRRNRPAAPVGARRREDLGESGSGVVAGRDRR